MLKFISDVLKRDKKNEKGFSLVELIVVVVILGILVAIAIPVYGAIQTTARHNATETAAANAASSIASHLAQGDTGISTTSGSNNKVNGTDSDGKTVTVVAADGYTYSVDPNKAGSSVTTVNTSTDDVFVAATNGADSEMTAWNGTSSVGKGHSW